MCLTVCHCVLFYWWPDMLKNGVLNLKEVTRIYNHQSLNYRKKKNAAQGGSFSDLYLKEIGRKFSTKLSDKIDHFEELIFLSQS